MCVWESLDRAIRDRLRGKFAYDVVDSGCRLVLAFQSFPTMVTKGDLGSYNQSHIQKT